MYTHTHTYACILVDVRGQLKGVSSLLLSGGFQGLDSECRAWQQDPLPTEPSHQPKQTHLKCGQHHSSGRDHGLNKWKEANGAQIILLYFLAIDTMSLLPPFLHKNDGLYIASNYDLNKPFLP